MKRTRVPILAATQSFLVPRIGTWNFELLVPGTARENCRRSEGKRRRIIKAGPARLGLPSCIWQATPRTQQHR